MELSILELFFRFHDPTTVNRQGVISFHFTTGIFRIYYPLIEGNDKGTQYRSVVIQFNNLKQSNRGMNTYPSDDKPEYTIYLTYLLQ